LIRGGSQASRNGVTGKYRQLLELPESIQTMKVKPYTSFKGLTYIWKSTVNILVCFKNIQKFIFNFNPLLNPNFTHPFGQSILYAVINQKRLS